jgi:hypothetical protein
MRPVEASQFAVRDFGEQNWVMLSSVNLSQDYQRQSLAHIVDAVERPRKRLASLIECGGHNRQGLGRVDASGFN